jgi:pimeloyl-ACP methyl ester carboxylesterase
MNELDLFRDFRRGVAPASGDAKGRASARLAGVVAGARVASSDRRRLRGSLARASGRRRRLVLLAAAALAALVGTASAFSTVRDFILDREAQSVDYCIGSALRPKVISFRSTDGVPLHGLLLGSGQNAIVLGAGNVFRDNLCDWLPFAQTLAQRGYRVLAFDARSLDLPRDRRKGLLVLKATHFERDVVGAERELVRRGVRRVLVGGASLGGTAAMTAAALIPRPALAGVVVLSALRKFGVMNAAAAARRVTAPAFFGVGSLDSRLVGEVRKLYAASAAERKQLVVVHSSGEGTDLLESSWAPPSFRAKLLAFVAAAFGRG